jgi:hypothetical protein
MWTEHVCKYVMLCKIFSETLIKISHTVNGCNRDGLAPPMLTTIIVVATIGMVEFGNLKVSGDVLNPLLKPSQRKPTIMTLLIPFGTCQISITHHKERTLTMCVVKTQPVSLGGA